ncbi:cyclin-T2-like [Portunus trituberculatus]|uniref:cyclin-T2-like n=1 Tax=Portunus trituberculatus TaxID=210409 RepID=UPI001E1CD1C5|nr:cyclin-T2-like [Portunus trituberculatus]
MAAEERWYFTKEELNNSPSRRCGIDAEKELSYRQQGANLIQDMGQRLQVNQLAINTAIVYMHRFYMFHPFTRFHRNAIAPAALFLAAKVEEQPRKLEHVIKVAYHCLFRDQPPLDTQSEGYLERAQELVVNENILLQTLGFDVAIDHPHTHVVKCCHLVRATKDLAQTSYFMATSSLHMTTMCLQYKPTVVACVCIYIVCTWSHYEIQRATEGKDWFWYVDKTVTLELLESLTAEFLAILDKCPNRLRKIMSSLQHTEDRGRSNQAGSSSTAASLRSSIPGSGQSSTAASHVHESHNSHNKAAIKVPPAQAHQHQQPSKLNLKEYNKREKERREREKMRDRDVIDPRDSNKFALVSTSHSSQAVASAIATIASSHAAMHAGLPVRSKSSSSRGSSHPEHLKASAVHSSNHKTHSHSTSQVVRDLQPSLESLRVNTEAPKQEQQQQQQQQLQQQQQQQQHQQQQPQQQRRDLSARSDSERYDKGSRTSSSAVDGRLQGDVKPSVSDIRQQQLLDVKPSRQSLESASIERKKEIKLEQKSVERKPPEPKPEQPKEEVKSQYNTIFHNSDLPEFALGDFMNDNSFLNLGDGPPDQLFDNSDTETKPDISAIIEDNSLLLPPSQQKNKSPVACQQQQVPAPQTQHQHASNNVTTNASSAGGNSDLRVSENASTTAGANHHSVRHHGTTNGSVAPSQPTHTTPQTSKSSSSKRSREAEKKTSERTSTEAELVPMVTKLEDTRYRTALSDPATPIKVRPDAASAAATNAVVKPPAAPALSTPAAPVEVPPKAPIEPVLRLKVPQPEHPKEPPTEPAVPVVVSGALITEHKKHKNDHPHHKHKEKKKHKHKEKDKYKDKEHKEHKEHKEKKKHKKHKDKDKDRDKASRAATAASAGDGGTAPIKITIPKDKILYTPKNSSVPLRTHAASAPPAPVTIPTANPNTTSNTPSIPKFKIDKSKLNKKDLFGGTSSTSPESSPAGDLARDTPTTSLKIKISRDRLRPDKESKKRERDHSPGEVPVAKLPRNGNEVRSSHAAPQVPIKDLDSSRWSSQRQ